MVATVWLEIAPAHQVGVETAAKHVSELILFSSRQLLLTGKMQPREDKGESESPIHGPLPMKII